ncbi:MAG: DNA-binding response regulator VicR [Candidatus Saccharibacteria bacterium]|nr:DNA-binding response regulator VicR [Candidatus Saccharibacteria bacterium]
MAKILLVEDELIISTPFSIVLKSKGHQVDNAENGNEALRLCQKKSYDLILLDIMMPYCNGVEFLKKANLKTTAPNTRVVVLTNLSGGNEIDETLMLGAAKTVLKSSITPALLLTLVDEELTLSKK